MSDLIREARLFATAAHGAIDQRRKYDGEPYINHPRRVADLVERAFANSPFYPEVVAAAWLHDVVEDTKVELDVIRWNFGQNVGDMVEDLTNEPSSAGNRKTRFTMNVKRLAGCTPEAASIKLADIIDNCSSIVQHDPTFAKVYLREKDKVISVLTHGHPDLLRHAIQVIEAGDKALSP